MDEAAPSPVLDTPLLAWEAQEYVHYEKSRRWYTIAGGLTVLLIAYLIFTQDYPPAITVALLAAVVYLYSHELPGTQRTVVSRLGITVGDKFYPYANIKDFWLIFTPDAHTLNFETSGRFGQVVTIQLGDMDPLLVRKTLSLEVPEAEGKTESFIDRLARMIRL